MEELKIHLSKSIKRLELVTKDLVRTNIVGNYRSVFKGHGLDFEDYRDYTPSDDASLIDWKATKKAGKTLIKEFVEERNLKILFLVDVSSTMMVGSSEKLKNEYAAELIASLAYVTLDADDSIGLVMFNDKIIKKLPPAKTKKQFYAILKSLANPFFYGGGYDLSMALKFAINSLSSDSVLIIASDFIGLHGEWQKYLKIAGGKFDIIGVMIRDPIDRVLPEEKRNVVLSDPISGKQILISPDQIRGRYGEYVKKQERFVKYSFFKANCDFLTLSTDKPFIGEITRFFKKRAKRFR